MPKKISMPPFDAAWFFAETPEAHAHFGPLAILSPPAGAPPSFVGDFVAQWRASRDFAPPFNYRLRRWPLPHWEELEASAIDLDYHLRHSALPAPGGERELGILVSRLHSHRLDQHRPLWECHVIEGLEGGRFAIYMKLHHGQLDGVGAARLMARTFSPAAEARDMQPPWAVGMLHARDRVRPRAKGGGLARWLNAMPAMAGGMVDFAVGAYLKGDDASTAPYQAPATLFNGRIGAQRRFATQHYPLSRFKAVARATGASVNDIFLTLCGGAIRRYLAEVGLLPARSLVAQVPVNVRAAGDASVGNAIGFIYARLHTEIAEPLARLDAVRRSAEAGKARHEAVPAAALGTYTLLVQAPGMAQIILGLGGRTPPAANLVISNVPGPRERLYFNGARVDQLYGPSVLFHGQALNITLSSYADEVNIGFTGCRDTLPSMQRLAVFTGEMLDELEAAVAAGGAPPP
ncbi:WS/DGAT/MGAT family O-acyltransferase [Zavarzinia compransoris]|uniref:diacylglycerol O-acyltransferase n=1 Tax=Zavarzinia compransoris TaxID=1264899 RepID=A0A317E6U4_9PROT|nr:wax ester/triacylglycerol synthase family O-acyltransferase [Zavarzinia compransoris]PWR22004.1 wax ester/triacylglycerol synthase family O-acyltransferase [Zavarzinia compransoris]TDP47257.1 WS/DGAT/MGAT family acyltransferase [Zavarzinia compransoris]